LDELRNIISGIYKINGEEILEGRSKHKEARRVLMYCSSKYCRYESSLTKLSKAFSVSVSGLTLGRDRFEKELKNDFRLQKVIERVESQLNR